ncbi:MAG TPA: glutamyl-tRNA reductase [Candidatus Krumholzibacteria bacterium]|nr:glutamyl-tRNA reductase [Candidatus Krumholzibacteria bacterium]
MSIVLVGLNHRTAPVQLREKLALAGCSLTMALEDLRDMSRTVEKQSISEAVVLSTCNRLEVYASVHGAEEGVATLKRFIGGLQNIADETLEPHLYSHEGDAAITHLMRVASGLDSMILGEPQILGQVTQAYEDARTAGATGPIISHLFAQAIHVGKRARTETGIARHTTSVAHVGAQKVLDEFGRERDIRVLVVGAGEMASLAAEVLQRSGAVELAFINRTFNRAEAMANDFNGRALAWHQLEEGLLWADALITATGAPHTIIYRQDLVPVLAARGSRSLVAVDLSVPRDIEDLARDLPGLIYYDIDNLQSVLDAHMELRRAAIPDVEVVVGEGVEQFNEWLGGRQVTPVIRNLREWAEHVAAQELEQAMKRIPDADDRTRQAVGRLAHRLINRLLHEPTTRLRMQAADGNGYGYAHAIRELFALDDLKMDCPRDRDGCPTPDAPPGAACNCECLARSLEAQES